MCNITAYGMLGNVENTRLLDVVDEMSRNDWWVKPSKRNPWKLHPTPPTVMQPVAVGTAAGTTTGEDAPTVFAKTDTDTGMVPFISPWLLVNKSHAPSHFPFLSSLITNTITNPCS